MNWLDFRVWDSKVNVAIRIHISLLSVFTRDSIYAIARMLSPVRPSVCPSVSPSHGCVIEKRLKLVLILCILDTNVFHITYTVLAGTLNAAQSNPTTKVF